MNAKVLMVILAGMTALLPNADGAIIQPNAVGWSDQQLYVIGSCMEECYADGLSTRVAMDKCFVYCLKESMGKFSLVQSAEMVSRVELVCRDSENLKIKMVRSEQKSANLYVVKVGESAKNSSFSKIVMSTTELVTLDDLEPNTGYNITAVTLNAEHSFIHTTEQQQFATLPIGYIPEDITTIDLANYTTNQQNEVLLDATVFWKPATDKTCYYEIFYHTTEYGKGDALSVHRVEQLYQFPIESLEFDTEYAIAVQAMNPTHRGHNSELQWSTFHTPSCADWHRGNEQLCAPAAVTDLHVVASLLSEDNYQLNITWAKPTLTPDFYVLNVYDLNSAVDEELTNVGSWNVTRNATGILIESFPIRGLQYEVLITVHANNQSTSHSEVLPVNRSIIRPIVYSLEKQAIIILTVVFILVCLVLVAIYSIRQRTTKTSLVEMRCEYHRDPENPPTPESEAHTNQTVVTIYNEMEITPSQVELQKVLGEGAFGMVRKGILTRSPSNVTEVAVKMLKDQPSAEEIKEFRQEIEVMVSVGSHPNIVSIVGYCSENDANEMMLLTEYCSEGNLLNFLKGEWERMSQIYGDPRTPTVHGCKKPESVFNFNTSFVDEKSLFGLNAFSNKLYQLSNEDENGNITTSRKETNTSGSSNVDSGERSKVIENSGYENVSYNDHSEELLRASARLIDFARQIATGMNFLARNRVVHRDLAARNILICQDYTVKISDFGLSRDVYQNNMYRKVGNGKLPIKWLALESLTHQIYTSQSDVWSFGILLYEICTLGATPYPLLSAGELIVQLKQGYRMEKPAGCSAELYDLMMSCWNAQPLERPTFCSVQNRLEVLTEQGAGRNEPLIDFAAIVVESCGSK